MQFISNAFSINMVESPRKGQSFTAKFKRLSTVDASEMVREDYFKSVIGHRDLAEVVGIELNATLPFNRESVKLRAGDVMLVCQYSGPRLPSGCTELPEGAQIDYFLVAITD
jgi:hypothetical protein